MKNIVLVEDDEPIRDTFQIIFHDADYNIINFENGEKITNAEIDAPDLFILDRQISGASGLDICRFIKGNEKYRNVPVIMLSASPDIMRVSKEAGADDAIAKPFSIKLLRETVSRLLI